jgi:hypothetical protein
MSNKQFIHIGANKTASTTMQRCLFSKHSDLNYMGEDSLSYGKDKDILNSIVYEDDLHYNHSLAENTVHDVVQSDNNKTFLYSNEDIMTSRIPSVCAKRLAQILPDAQIIIVIRNQLTAIPSWYANHGAFLRHVPKKYWKSYVSFNDWMNYCFDFLNYSPLDSYFYYEIINLYASLFGKENIHVLLFEDYIKDPVKFISQLCSIMEIDKKEALALINGRHERKRLTQRQFNMHRFQSQLFLGHQVNFSLRIPFINKLWQKYLQGGKSAENFLTPHWHNKLLTLYQESNTQLAKSFGLPLKQHNYPLNEKNNL